MFELIYMVCKEEHHAGMFLAELCDKSNGELSLTMHVVV